MVQITAKGKQAVESAAKSNVDLSKVLIRLKDGESIKVSLLSSSDYVEYPSMGDFQLKVFTQPVRDGVDYFVKAGQLANEGKVDEKFKSLYKKNRYLIAMADVTTGTLRYWDASKKQFQNFAAQIADYADIIDDGEEAMFTFKRTGNGTDTTYTLQYVPRLSASDKENFHMFDGQVVNEDDFLSVLNIQEKSAELQVGVLKEAGFPVDEFFPEIKLDTEDNSEEDATPLDEI